MIPGLGALGGDGVSASSSATGDARGGTFGGFQFGGIQTGGTQGGIPSWVWIAGLAVLGLFLLRR